MPTSPIVVRCPRRRGVLLTLPTLPRDRVTVRFYGQLASLARWQAWLTPTDGQQIELWYADGRYVLVPQFRSPFGDWVSYHPNKWLRSEPSAVLRDGGAAYETALKSDLPIWRKALADTLGIGFVSYLPPSFFVE